MSMPVVQPPPFPVTEPSYHAHSAHGSIGSLIGVLVVIIILGVVAGMIGRLCSGRRIMGYGQYDVDSWMERKCSSCIDGGIGFTSQRPAGNESSTGAHEQHQRPGSDRFQIQQQQNTTEGQIHQNQAPES